MPSPEKILIELTRNEALVLFEYLARSDEHASHTFVHQAEQNVLWRLEGELESQLVEVLSPHYKQALQAARAALQDHP